MSNAIAGVTGGIAAGNRLGNRTIETAKNVGGSARNIRDTFREGMYGEKEKAANENNPRIKNNILFILLPR